MQQKSKIKERNQKSIPLQPSTYNLQPSTYNLQPATCNLQPVTCNLQLDNVNLPGYFLISGFNNHEVKAFCITTERECGSGGLGWIMNG